MLARKAAGAEAPPGSARVTVSLDALDDAIFRRMNDADFPVADVLRRHRRRRARRASARSRSTWSSSAAPTTHEIVPMARHFRGRDVALRFIEYMDVGATNGWRMDEVLPSARGRSRASARRSPLERLPADARRRDRRALALRRPASPARSARSRASRRRSAATATGRACRPKASSSSACSPAAATTCARCCAAAPATPRSPPRSALIWQARDDRYSELRGRAERRTPGSGERRVEMHYIGG